MFDVCHVYLVIYFSPYNMYLRCLSVSQKTVTCLIFYNLKKQNPRTDIHDVWHNIT